MSVPELARARWRKSRRSTGSGDNCVEVAGARGVVGIRDSKSPEAGPLVLSQAAWRVFAAQVKSGHLDR